MAPAVEVQHLSKRYRLGSRDQAASYHTLRESMAAIAVLPLRLIHGRSAQGSPRDLWALNDISFEVREGEALGVIGRNGAGKSTLLKILSRITEPTLGYADVYGRVGTLLEVGTGFHPELTGRENIYLNGAILGMSRADISARLDGIVDFAGLEAFLETPVKRYSSGMYMRLAFSVAAHLEPDILVVDEVLAVGDAEFQEKCLGKMGEVARTGRTVLFVSHNIPVITRLCTRALWLDEGKLKALGPVQTVTQQYQDDLHSRTSVPLDDRIDRVGDGRIRLTGLHLEDSTGVTVAAVRSGDDCSIVLRFVRTTSRPLDDVVTAIAITDASGNFILHHRSDFTRRAFSGLPDHGEFVCRLHRLPLAYGQYSVNTFVGIRDAPCDSIYNAATLVVEPGDFFGTGHQGVPELCSVLNDAEWSIRS